MGYGIVTQNCHCFLAPISFIAIPSFTVQNYLTRKLRLFKTHKIESKCQNDTPCLASMTTCRFFFYNFARAIFINSRWYPNNSLLIATYGMSLDQSSFNQDAYLPKQRGTILHHQSTSSQTIPSQQIQDGFVLFIFVFSQFSFVKFTR